MDYNKRIKELEAEIRALKVQQHNAGMEGVAKSFQKDIHLTETAAEDKFYEIALKKKLKLKRQHRINIIRKEDNYIEKFYFVDFCDITHKIVFEVDGGYHFEKEQMKKDKQKDKNLRRMGYKVFRITNAQIIKGKTTQFLIECYKKIGINI